MVPSIDYMKPGIKRKRMEIYVKASSKPRGACVAEGYLGLGTRAKEIIAYRKELNADMLMSWCQ
jgi:hypothetical protein